MARSELAAIVEDALQPVGPVHLRAMFGGHGVFLDGLMFALIAGEVLYLKADDKNRPAFDSADLGPFVYETRNGPITTSYHEAPDVLDDWAALEPWARGALDAAMRADARKRALRSRRR